MNVENINKINNSFGNIINTKSSHISFKKWDQDFNKTQYYKNFTKKFYLPDIQKKGYFLFMSRQSLVSLDTATFSRKIKSGKVISINSLNNTTTQEYNTTMASINKSKQIIPFEKEGSNFSKFKMKIEKIVKIYLTQDNETKSSN